MEKRVCATCGIEKDITGFHKHPKCKGGRRRSCKLCYKEKCRSYPSVNIGTRVCSKCNTQKNITNFYKDPGNPEGRSVWCKECAGEWRANYGKRNPDIGRKAYKKYAKENKDKIQAKWALRKARKLRAIPRWADLARIKEIYSNCYRISEETGIKHHVDHIIPLVNSMVSGLHVPENLQIIPAVDNWKKNNFYSIE